jgi:hypothetical protein
VLSLALGVVLPSAIVPAQARREPERHEASCWYRERGLGGVSWDPAGDRFALRAYDRTSSRLEVVEWPAFETRVIDRRDAMGIGHHSIAMAPDGVVYWSGYDIDGPGLWRAEPGEEPARVLAAAESPAFSPIGDLAWTDDGLVGLLPTGDLFSREAEVVRISPEGELAASPIPGIPEPAALSVSRDGDTLLVEARHQQASRWTLIEPSGSRPFELPEYSYLAVLTPDASRVVYSGHGGIRSRALDGTDDRAESEVPWSPDWHAASARGIIASVGFDRRALPTETHARTMASEVCFALASWAEPGAVLPALPEPEPIAKVRFERPNRAVRRLASSLPDRVAGAALTYLGDQEGEAGRGLVRVPDNVWDPLFTPLAAAAVGADPDATWTDQAYLGDRREPVLRVVADGRTRGRRWVSAMESVLLARHPDLAVRDVAIGGRGARLVSGLDPVFGPVSLVWPAGDVYLVASGPYAYVITTDSRRVASALARALP